MKTKFNGILTLLLALVVQISFAQDRTISGTVSDDSGALPGVTVLKKGTSIFTETDFDGNYTIKAKTGDVLVFSYVGMQTTEKTVNASNNVSFNMKSNTLLDEVVVTGVARGTSTKKLGFSLAKVDSEALQAVPASDPANALRGKVAGIRIVQPSGNPAAAASIRLRGSTSISGSQSPLIIVDGIITSGSLKDIAVEDIASMEVIKGAAASSLYGSLAGNGVIQIITKKGKGKLSVDFKSEYGLSEIARDYPLSTAHPYKNDPLGVRNGDWDGDPTTPETSNFGFDLTGGGGRVLDNDGLFDNPYLSENYNNPSNVFTNQPVSTNTISLSGSDEKIKYYLSAQNFKQGGVIEPIDNFTRNTFRSNFTVKATEKLTAKFNGSLTNSKGPSITEQGQGANVFYSALVVEPFIDLTEKTADGKFSNAPNGYTVQGSNFQNPLYTQQERDINFKRQRLVFGIDLNYDIDENWSVSAAQSLDKSDTEGYSYTPKGYITPTPTPTLNNGAIQRSESFNKVAITSTQVNYRKEFKDLTVGVSAKYLFENRQFRNISAGGFDFIANGVFNIQNTPLTNRNQSSYFQKEIARNYFLNLDLDYQDKLIFNVLGRRDESSLFGENERIKYYGRASLAYRLTQDIEINNVQELKFRAAYGTSGQRPPVFNAQYETWAVNNTGIFPGSLGNQLLKPSVSAELELGLDATFFNKYSLVLNYSKTKTSDAHIQVPLSGVAGFISQWQNVGEIQSDYIEASLSGELMKTDDFSWDFNLNFDTGTQVISELNGVPPFTRSGLGAVDIFRVEEDLPYGTMYGNVLASSVDQLSVDDNGQVLNGGLGGTVADYSVNQYGHVVRTSSIGTSDENPILLFDKDSNSNHVGQIGNTNPDFNVGFSTSFKYKGIGLYVLTDWQQGGDIYNYTKQLLYFNERHADLQKFAANGTHLNYGGAAGNLYNKSDPNSHFVEDGTFVKIREISLDYTLDGDKLGNTVDSIRFALAGRNLFTFTDYTGWDPEVAINTNPTNFRLDEFAYPNFRSYTFSVQVKF